MAEGGVPKPFVVPTTPEAIQAPEQIWSEFFGDPEELQVLMLDLRQRHAAVLEMDGEPFYWLKRRLDGTVCPYWDDQAGNCRDPLNADATCYNTKYLGGYHFPLSVKVALPSVIRSAVYQETGLMKMQPMKAWTLWTPRMSDRDMLVNPRTGQRFELLNVQESGPWRGLFIVQFFDTRVLVAGADYGMRVPVVAEGVEKST